MSDSTGQKFSVVFTGSRDWSDDDAVWTILNALRIVYLDLEVHVGDAKGLDSIVQMFCVELAIPCHVYTADWNRYGKKAGPIRNRKMLDESDPDLVFAFPLMTSKGTRDCIHAAQERGIRVEVRSWEQR